MRPVLIRCVLLLAAASVAARCQTVTPEVQALYERARAAQAAEDTATAVADYEKILRLAPDLAPAYNNLGRLYYNLGKFSQAVDVLKRGLALAPEMHGAEVMLGASYFQMGRFAEAEAPLRAGVQAFPQDRFAGIMLVRTLLALHRPAETQAQLESLLKMDSKDQEAWYLLGKIHLQLSEEAFGQVQAIAPETPLAHELAGEVMESMQNTAGAVAEYKQAIAGAPNDAAARQHLAEVYWSTGDWTHAKEQYRLLLAREPGRCTARWKLANAMDEAADPAPEVLQEIDRALGDCPELPQARAERARVLLRLGRPAEAIPELKAAEKAAPEEVSLQRLLAQAYRGVGDKANAEAANRRFQQLDAAQHAAKERHAAAVIQANQ